MDQKERTDLVVPFTQSFNNSVEDILIDMAEVSLDAIMDEGILKEVPIISTVVSAYKIGKSLKERSYIRKLAIFIQEINKDIADDKKRQEYVSQILTDKEKSQRDIEVVLLLLDRFVYENKAKHLEKMYMAYVKKRITWLEFCQYSEILDRMLPGDDGYLDQNVFADYERDELSECALQRLQSLGIIMPNNVGSTFDVEGNALSIKHDGTYVFTEFGKLYYQIITDES